ncbi:MAG TPA: PQQ-dependent sugar dehydrogenase [Longimicrobiaceae bacterium]|nr:PQQ-dependent sugar dehydrogenase [Longimicrobiaceae bacterium]
MPATRTSIAALAGALLLAAVAPTAAQQQLWGSEAGPVRVVDVAAGLEQPWSMAWLPNGDMLVTEKAGRLRLVRDGVLDPTPIAGVPEVRFRGQGGLLDVVLHPNFAANRLVYLSYAKPNADGSQGTTAVARGRLDGHALTGVDDIFVADAWNTTAGHYGSRLAFDADGYLFITVGDRQFPPSGVLEEHPAQDPSNHVGTINRLNDDGSVPQDNPFVGMPNVQPSIWSYGHRSPQGLAIHPVTGDIWQSEHGPQGGDELNRILPGRNYGWPVIGYGVNYGGAQLHRAREMEGMEQPVYFFTPSIGTSGLMIYTGDVFDAWNGSIFLGGMAFPELHRLPLIGDDHSQIGRPERPPLLSRFARIRDIRQGPDGFIYLALDERNEDGRSRVVRLEPAETN